jgi:hypothetical protein
VYTNAEPVTNVFQNTGVYGKVDNAHSTVDVYTFTAEQDGDQTFTLLGHAPATAQPFLVFVDSTDATAVRDLGIPLPSPDYHTALVTATDGQQKYYEPATFEQYNIYAQQHIALHKDKKYFLIVFDPSRQLTRYAIKFGDAKIWSAKDVFSHPITWLKLKADVYGGSSPFKFTPSTFGAILFFIAFGLLLGLWLIESTFAFLSNRSKMAGYLLIKFQQSSRIFTWVSLWFLALGGYIYFDALGWPGIPFILGLVYILVLAVFLVRTLVIAPKLMKLSVSKQEAAIPLPLQKQLYLMFVLSFITLGGFLVLLTMQFS